MEEYTSETTEKKEQFIEEDDFKDSFMEGYSNDEEIEECAECGSAVHEEKRITKSIEGEAYIFCSSTCADDFVESISD